MGEDKFRRVFVATVAIALGTPLSAAVIGLDGRDGPTGADLLAGGSRFTSFRSVIASMGNTTVSKSAFTSTDLAGLDVLILKQAGAHPYSDAEISAIHAFVAAGHGLIVLAEGGGDTNNTVANLNTLVAPYGITYAALPTENSGWTVTGFNSHPVTSGISTIGVDYQRRIASTTAPAQDLTTGSGADDCLAVVDGMGHGNIVFLSDASLWTDAASGAQFPIDFGNNELLLRNAVSFASVPEPSTLMLVGIGSLTLIARRRQS